MNSEKIYRDIDRNKMVNRLSQLPERKGKIKADFHSHVYTNFRPSANRWWGEPGRRDLGFLLEKTLSKRTDVLGITNYEDRNYEFWTSKEQLDSLPQDWRYYQDARVTYVERADREGVYFIKTEEVPTKQGHMLFIGTRSGTRIKSGENTKKTIESLDEQVDDCVTVCADHPYSRFGGLRKYIDGIEHLIDALEYNANMWFSNRKTLRHARKVGKKVIANSDSHRPRDIGKAKTIFNGEDLNYDNGERFVSSIKASIKKGNFEIEKGLLSPWSVFHHALITCFYIALSKIGLIKIGERDL